MRKRPVEVCSTDGLSVRINNYYVGIEQEYDDLEPVDAVSMTWKAWDAIVAAVEARRKEVQG